METKTCKKCGEEKPIEKFIKQKKNGNNYTNNQCSSCQYKIWKSNKLNNINPKDIYVFAQNTGEVLLKICSVCKSEKKPSEFSKDKRNKFGLGSECLNCGNARYRAKHPRPVYKDVEVCGKCKKEKPLYSFPKYKRQDKSIGYCVKCNGCKRSPKTKIKTHQPYLKNENLVKFCIKCQTVKPIEKFAKKLNSYGYCKPCNTEHSLNYTYRKKSATKTTIKFSKSDIVKRDGLTCYLCEKTFTADFLTIEHLIPLSRGGDHKPENVKLACLSCNCSKNAKTLTEFKKYRGDYNYLR